MPSSRAPASATQYDSDAAGGPDEEMFVYESDDEPVVNEPIVIEDDEEEEDEEGDVTAKPAETITIYDDDLGSDLDEPPPEPVSRPKGKITSRKQYMNDVEMLLARYGAHDGEQVIGKSPLSSRRAGSGS